MRAFFFTSILLTLLSCVSSETLNSENDHMKRYAFGKGGGFTGDYTEFILNENGKIYKYDYKYDREVFYKDLNKADLNYFLEEIEKLSLDGIEMNSPGNISYYIDVRIGKSSINKIVWGDPRYYPAQAIVDLNKEAFSKLSELEP